MESEQKREHKLMMKAIEECYKGVECGDGHPFGAVIVRNGEVVVSCHNMLSVYNDPTAHAEVTAIREACKRVNNKDLSDCEMYSSCEPCPMCYGAIYFSGIKRLVYGSKIEATAVAGFNFNSEPFLVATRIFQKAGIDIKQAEPDLALMADKVYVDSKGKFVI